MKRWAWILPLAAAAALGGCGGSSHPTSAPSVAPATTTPATTAAAPSTTSPPATSPSTTSPSTTSPPTTSSPSSTSTTASTSASTQCRTANLSASLAGGNGTAGSVYYRLELTNTGSGSCTLRGYPGVSFVAGSDGHQVGAAATRVSGSEPVVTLAPGHSASATLQVLDAGNFGTGCSVTSVRGLRVYPPNQTAALFVAHPFSACANSADVTLRIQPFLTAG